MVFSWLLQNIQIYSIDAEAWVLRSLIFLLDCRHTGKCYEIDVSWLLSSYGGRQERLPKYILWLVSWTGHLLQREGRVKNNRYEK
jgi:hypothetical protein